MYVCMYVLVSKTRFLTNFQAWGDPLGGPKTAILDLVSSHLGAWAAPGRFGGPKPCVFMCFWPLGARNRVFLCVFGPWGPETTCFTCFWHPKLRVFTCFWTLGARNPSFYRCLPTLPLPPPAQGRSSLSLQIHIKHGRFGSKSGFARTRRGGLPGHPQTGKDK